MTSRLHSRLTYANVMATVAVFLALGGGAYAIAVAKNSVKSRHIAPNAVRSSDIKNRAVRGVDIRTNSIDGGHVLEGRLGSVPRAALADTLDGQDSSAFLGVNGKAADANTLDGQDSGAFLGVNGTAADAQLLDGQDSSAFLGVNGMAADAQLLDGMDSLEFTRLAGSVQANGDPAAGSSGFTSSKTATGQYFISFPAGTFGTTCRPPIAIAIPTTGALRFATIAGTQCTNPPDGSGGFFVETYDDDGLFTQVDTPFAFMAR